MNTPRLLTKYRKEVIPAMRAKFGYKNVMQVPKINKAVLNIGTGRYVKDEKMLEKIEKDLALLTGQKPIATMAKKSIASFKIREGMKIGYKATLRKSKMYDFIDRLISIALPRTRDFRGLDKKSFEKGVLNIGISEHSIFPEIHYETLKDVFGLEVSVITSAKNKEEAVELLKLLGFPLK
ncbi:MAG: large subunit ribosomal protein L5 [Parcubacteria group bacterium Gr01-1014_44]|nr:MAG: large subunit ribosomal protein L5 [Parcubacteria group bacterium Gr01-1014_44]